MAPGLIDLHVWGEPDDIAQDAVQHGTTGFLAAIGPESPQGLVNHLVQFNGSLRTGGATCLGVHLEGPFLNPLRAGALAGRWLRPPARRELGQLAKFGGKRLRLMTLAPELPGALDAVRWGARRGLVVSLGHTDASDFIARQAVQAGARAVTHIFNGMRPLHHRGVGLLGEALTNDALTAMVILDGVHLDPRVFRLLVRCKGVERLVLATDSIRHHRPKGAALFRGAYYLQGGMLAGSNLTMIDAVRNAVAFGGVSVAEAVRMASLNPARLIGEGDRAGSLQIGKRADLVVFDDRFRVALTLVAGKPAYRAKA
ncbi:MAG: N-acetylglucosamine-6-phosphate deacetylase [Candidatus Omnitrophica bacterium]|nr:N-acetylglucosamine-6-phosphate deacetylase [Candidatus Omnitrophota bacterium]